MTEEKVIFYWVLVMVVTLIPSLLVVEFVDRE
jgi:hypothetical protein